MVFLASVAFVIAAFSLGWTLVQSYRTEGGAHGQVPVLAGPVLHQAPAATLGAFLLGVEHGSPPPWWQLAGLFLGVAALGIAVTLWVGGVKARRRSEKP